VGPRAGLDRCGKSRPHRDLFIYLFIFRILCFIVLVLDFQLSFVSYRTACCGFFQQEKSDGSVSIATGYRALNLRNIRDDDDGDDVIDIESRAAPFTESDL
jgi:hypothetical protein